MSRYNIQIIQFSSFKTNNFIPIYLLISSLIILTGCFHPVTNNDMKPYFPIEKETSPDTITEILEGTLTAEDGYLTINEYTIIWPCGYSYSETNNTTEIIDSIGDVITSVGNDILVNGMEMDISEPGSITEFAFPENMKNNSRFLAIVSINEPLPEVHFPVNKEACDVITLGMAKGTLIIENGYLKVMDRVIIWPYGYTISYEENAISVIDEEGNIAGKVGDYMGLAGDGTSKFSVDSRTDYVFPEDYMSYDFFDAQDVIETTSNVLSNGYRGKSHFIQCIDTDDLSYSKQAERLINHYPVITISTH